MLLINNGEIIDSGRRFKGYIIIKGERIATVGQGRYEGHFEGETIDASDMMVIPGVIDDQVHFREPGLTHKGNISSESRAAAAGGVTSFMDMPNTNPPTTTPEALEQKIEAGYRSAHTNFSFFFGATNDNIKYVQRLDRHTVPGVKLFMGSSTGNMLVDDERTLSEIFDTSPLLIAAHCEHEPTVQADMQRYKAEYGSRADARLHPLVRSAEACYRSSAHAVELADRYGSRFHLLHLSTERELSLFEDKPLAGKRITNEVCAHHLWFSDADYATKGNFIKWNPSIKSITDRDALRRAVVSGRVDIVATDHAPHTLEEKSRDYWSAPSGGPMIQHSLCVMLEMFSPEVVVERMCNAPAVCFGIRERGSLKEGMYADIAIVAKERNTVTHESLLYKCGWSPVEGLELSHKVAYTIVNGTIVYKKGEINEDFRGKLLEFD